MQQLTGSEQVSVIQDPEELLLVSDQKLDRDSDRECVSPGPSPLRRLQMMESSAQLRAGRQEANPGRLRPPAASQSRTEEEAEEVGERRGAAEEETRYGFIPGD